MALTDVNIFNQALSGLGESQVTLLADKVNINAQTIYDETRNEVQSDLFWGFCKHRTRLTAAGILDCSAKTIAFVEGTPDTVTDSGAGFVDGGFEDGDRLQAKGSSSNDSAYGVADAATGTLTIETNEEVTAEVLTNDADLKLYASPADKWSYKYPKPSDFLVAREVNGSEFDSLTALWAEEGDYIVTNEINSYDQIDFMYTRQVTDPTKFPPFFKKCFVMLLKHALVVAIGGDPRGDKADKYRDKYDKLLLKAGTVNASQNNRGDTRQDTSWQTAGR